MEGEALICYNGGWACSNDAAYVVERDIITKENGQMFSKHTVTIRVMDYFVTGNTFSNGDEVKVAFKSSEEGTKKGYKAKVNGLTDAMAVLAVSSEIEVKTILDTIKQQRNGY